MGGQIDGAAPIALRKPYLLLLADIVDPVVAKTAFGLRDWLPDDVVGQWRFSDRAVDLGLPDLDPEAAVRAGARSVVVGAAPVGGRLPAHWVDALAEAARAGLDVVSGLHARLGDLPALVAAAETGGAALHDVRRPPDDLPIGTGHKRPGKRLLTVGADCAIGKKYAALAIARGLRARGVAADFRATGQTGIMIAGSGIPIDSVVADFLAGAAELLSPAAAPDHWDVVEGQGSLFHPSYAGVALGLIHGSQPDALVLCYDPARREIDGCEGFAIPDIATAIARNVEAARLTNPAARCVGLSLNTSRLSDGDARGLLEAMAAEHGLPVIDPLRFGVDAIVDALI
ncbi:DUF1611 domain-containing protein [uncultured Sphingomonas sp.]|uniref:DUF1611 domain-containing protein n=1 Tax=uncultured Sphingomonas sp. TaxID=158754 RepID=UPI0035CA0831